MPHLLFGFIVSCLVSINIFATSSAADEFTAILNNIHTVSADFKQDNKISGSMMIARPGKFRWEITQPNKQLIIINQNQLSIYDIDLEQVTKRKMNYNKPGNPAMLLSSDTQVLKNTFKITKLNQTIASKDVWFELTPKKGDYQKVQMHFVSGKLVTMNIIDTFEQKSLINFSNIRLNTDINLNKFILTVPSGTDVNNENE